MNRSKNNLTKSTPRCPNLGFLITFSITRNGTEAPRETVDSRVETGRINVEDPAVPQSQEVFKRTKYCRMSKGHRSS